jgi:polyhydroxybutyrate depolymerase
VTFCTIAGGGHTWPGGKPYKIPGLEIGKVSYDISANEAIWEFFKKHPIEKN